MICPNCGGNSEPIYILDPHKEAFEIDRCAHCGGIWLDVYELERIPPEKAEEIDIESESYDSADLLGMNCPHCHVPLEEFHHPRLGELVFQRCPDCHGFWLQRGQLLDYMNIKKPVPMIQTDPLGTMTMRDRMIMTFSTIVLMVIVVGFIFSYRSGLSRYSADNIIIGSKSVSPLWITLLISSLVLFAIGLILAVFRKNRHLRLIGWILVIIAIFILIYLIST